MYDFIIVFECIKQKTNRIKIKQNTKEIKYKKLKFFSNFKNQPQYVVDSNNVLVINVFSVADYSGAGLNPHKATMLV